MLARHEQAIIAALKARPGLQRLLRAIGPVPATPDTKRQLDRYLVDAPAVYVEPLALVVKDGLGQMQGGISLLVRNVAGNAQARHGDGVDTGIDPILICVLRTVHDARLGEVTWAVRSAGFSDEVAFDLAGLTVMQVAIESTMFELPAGVDLDSLDDLEHVHMDMDIAPHAGSAEYGKWLQEPPDYTTGAPDLQADVPLPGAGNPP